MSLTKGNTRLKWFSVAEIMVFFSQEVEVVTGEEEESNVLQANGKLYLFDSEVVGCLTCYIIEHFSHLQKRNWTERGRGQFRLNDDPVSEPGHLKSRFTDKDILFYQLLCQARDADCWQFEGYLEY